MSKCTVCGSPATHRIVTGTDGPVPIRDADPVCAACLDRIKGPAPVRRFALVYQAGIANIFQVSAFNAADYGRDARRVLQSDFRTAEAFARGCIADGAMVAAFHCNRAGDIIGATWDSDLDRAPFRDSMRPVFNVK